MTALATHRLGAADLADVGARMMAMMRELYPVCRSITGSGVRETLRQVSRVAPLTITEVPTGTPVFDWTVPKEWSITEAYLEHESGQRFAEFGRSNLHVVNYSAPIDVRLKLEELLPRIYTLPAHPEWVPFRSSYYKEDWGFCMSERERSGLPAGQYRAVIRSELRDGALTLGEFVHRGRTDDEVLLFAHTCHPSLCNDNLSGIVVAAQLAAFLSQRNTRHSYRVVFAPATIGSISWLALNEQRLNKIRHGLVLAMLGDCSPFHYHPTLGGIAVIDRAARLVFRDFYPDATMLRYSPWGFDERQFNSPGVRLPVGRIGRALTGQYPQEHTSADSLDLMSEAALAESWLACLRMFEILEQDRLYTNLSPKGEPQLGRRGLYRATGGHYDGVADRQMGLLWLLNQSDGHTSLLEIAERSGLPFGLLARCAQELELAGLLGPVTPPAS
jgi:aminopeptidase-like protein